MRTKTPRVHEDVSPNLIPMIDIMFLLLLFFMLSTDMSHRALEDVRPPTAASAKEPPPGMRPDRFTVNVFHRDSAAGPCAAYARGAVCRDGSHWRVAADGRDFTAPEALAVRLREEADRGRSGPTPAAPSERGVSVRADAAAPYGLVQGVMISCAKAGIYKVECAARPNKPATH